MYLLLPHSSYLDVVAAHVKVGWSAGVRRINKVREIFTIEFGDFLGLFFISKIPESRCKTFFNLRIKMMSLSNLKLDLNARQHDNRFADG